MPLHQTYRTWIFAGLVAGVAVSMIGCGDSQKTHATLKQEQNDRWNATRVAVMVQLATQQYQVGDFDKCRETLTQAYAMNYPVAALHILSAKIELEKGSLETANNHLKLAVQLDAADPEPYYLLGVVNQRWQNMSAAHDYYKLAWDKKPGEAVYLLAVVEMEMTMGHYDEAQALLEERAIYFEQSAGVRAALAKIYTLKGQYEQACKYYREATMLSADDAALRRNLGESYYFAGHYADALPIFEHLISDVAGNGNPEPGAVKNDDAVSVVDPSLHLLLARTYIALHRLSDARNVLREMVRLDPHNDLAWLTLGKASLESGDLSQAGIAASRVLKSDPESLDGLILLAAVQQKGKQWPQAGQTLEHAARVAPADATVLCMQGLNVQSQGHAALAAGFYTKALAAKPGDSWAEDLLASIEPKAHEPKLVQPKPELESVHEPADALDHLEIAPPKLESTDHAVVPATK